MTRLRQPFIDLSEADAAVLRKAGFGQMIVWRWRNKRGAPSRISLPRVIKALGRDPRQPAPVAPSNDATVASEILPPVNRAISRPRIEINPCVDDGVCLAVRKAAMQPATANTLLESKREIPCMNCRQGIERARAEAAKKKASAGRVGDICACGEPKSYGSVVCIACRDEKRRALA